MPRRAARLLEDFAARLNALPGVFSTPQWGGRAYKLPGRGGRDRPRLLAFVCADDDAGGAISVSFKLDRARAAEVARRLDWVRPHAFRTLAPAGWLTASLTTKRQAAALAPLLAECHAALGGAAAPIEEEGGDRTAGHIDRVMSEARARGWTPPDTDEWG